MNKGSLVLVQVIDLLFAHLETVYALELVFFLFCFDSCKFSCPYHGCVLFLSRYCTA